MSMVVSSSGRLAGARSLYACCACVYECLIALFMGIDCDEDMGGHDFVSD